MQTNVSMESGRLEAPAQAVNTSSASWGAIFAGAAAAAAISMVLLILGTGLGLATSSPWSDQGLEASTIGISSIAWVFVTQIIAAGLGGYLAGRLRMKWPDVQTDEVFFRDTAHGLLTWAVASLLTAALLGTAVAGALSSGLKAGAAATAVAGGAVVQAASIAGPELAKGAGAAAGENQQGTSQGTAANGSLDYFVGGLFRGDQPDPAATAGGTAAATSEAMTILAYSVRAGQLNPDDKARLGQLITRHTGLSQADAEKRATEIYYRVSTELANAEAAAKGAADRARKAAAHISLWFFVALLCGAFSASFMATIGGRQRDTWGG